MNKYEKSIFGKKVEIARNLVIIRILERFLHSHNLLFQTQWVKKEVIEQCMMRMSAGMLEWEN